MKLLFLAACAALLAVVIGAFSPAIAQSGSSSAPGSHSGGGPIQVAPGQTGSNGDISVTNNSTKRGVTATIKPGKGGTGANSICTTQNHFKGSISGFDTGDAVHLGNNGETALSGEGGAVYIGSSSSFTVTNTAPTGGANISLNFPGGGTGSVPPGSSYSGTTP